MTYFKDCTTLNEVKAQFKKLAMQFHPDLNTTDTTAIMQDINKEYAFAIAKVAAGGSFTAQEAEAEILNAEGYKNAISAIIHLEGINIELCGGWIWVSGNTYPVKSIIKGAGFFFASVKKMWYFRSVEHASANFKPMAIDQIRVKYGSQVINHKTAHYNYLAQ